MAWHSMVGRILRHIREHPWRLLATMATLVLISWAFAAWALFRTLDAAHIGRVENCRANNEVIIQLHLALTDAGYPTIGDRFRPTTNCEELP